MQKTEGMETRILTIIFDQTLRHEEIGAFRGALLTLLPDDPVLHNHSEDTVLYRYPKVQYKTIGGKAAVIGMADGAEILESELATGDELTLKTGRRTRRFTVTGKTVSYFNPVPTAADGYIYRISDWIPLNQKNHAAYQETLSLKERIELLDRILIINILAAHKKGLQHVLDYECIAYITDILDVSTTKYKGVEMLSFDVEIFSNTPLPEYCGLGKGSARGHGVVTTKG